MEAVSPADEGPSKDQVTTAELYQIQPYYRRFNQKYNVTRQRLWNPDLIQLAKDRDETLERLLQEERPGYGALDWAFYRGSEGNRANTGFVVNVPNARGNSWQPLSNASPKHRWHGDPATASRILRKIARLFSASQVGFASLDRRWVYSHYWDEETNQDYPVKFSDEPGYEQFDRPCRAEDRSLVIPKEMRYVVVIVYEMDEEGIARAPTAIQMATVSATYSRICFTTVMVAEFIRGLGYNAVPSANCTALSIPLAVEAGLGQLGRNAKLINPTYGPRCRISKVITDLPLETGRPRDFGVTEFCNACKKCARMCPAQAIPYGERSFESANECNNGGVLQWMTDHKKCAAYMAKVGTNCGICIRACPFNKGHHKIHDVTRFFIKHAPWVDPLIVRLDDAMGFGRYKPPADFWDEKTPHQK
ncbi:MAG: reductive dehalogenase [Chloroflexi bacterium]|nr:reductive dehalogenase [Chloroflexota bacterium]